MTLELYLRAELSLFFIFLATLMQAQTGTGNGTYTFGALGNPDSGGPGFKTQQDKFKVSNVFELDVVAMFAQNAATNTSQTVIIKAEGGAVNKRFTLQNMRLSNQTSTALSVFTLTLRNSKGVQIAQHSLAGNLAMSTTSKSLTSFNFTTAYPAAGYNNVSEIEITYRYSSTSTNLYDLNFHDITLANVSSVVLLPLNLAEFKARKENDGIRVSWSTSSETNSGLHVIEHSTDGIHFTALAEFRGSNLSTTTLKYTYLHTSPPPGRNYYRLKEISVDGTERIFPITIVDMELTNVIVAGPNPFKGLIYVKGLEKGNIGMYLTDMTGKVVWKKAAFLNAPREQTLMLPALLPRGVYTLSIYSNNKISAHQLVKD